MVKVREAQPLLGDGSIDIDAWLKKIMSKRTVQDESMVRTAYDLAHEYHVVQQGLLVAEILDELGLDTTSLIAGLLYEAFHTGKLSAARLKEIFGNDAYKLVAGVQEMDTVHARNPLKVSENENAEENLHNLRKMLLAVVEDVRVVLIKLAIHMSAMRIAAQTKSDSLKTQLAYEAKEIYAPLANRLGIGQVKWELEDFAFRFLHPDLYKNIATLLDERRVDREKYIAMVQEQLKNALLQQDIHAEIYGRVKHIYSIWRKMQRKMVGYNEIYDVRALRIIVPTIADCYAALGVVHTLWQHIPKEFDDYIANPKSNGYKSLHTAVLGPQGRTIEVQIRTRQMHEQAELGVAAHWRYKEGREHEPYYEKKLNQLRQILNWQDELVLDGEAVEALRAEFFADRVYVFTPKGDVIDLPNGATAIDLAYHIHSSIGERCRGAKVNGRMIPLNQPLPNGAQVEILTAKEGGPSRDWLNPHLKYIVTSRAKAKIAQWFKLQNRDQNIHDGRENLHRELKRLGFDHVNIKELSHLVAKCNSEEDLLAGLGSGDIKMSQVIGALQRLKHPPQAMLHPADEAKAHISPAVTTPRKKGKRDEVIVAGIDNLLSHMARCCKPIPGDEIIGYITLGEGIAIHRQDCINVLQVSEAKKSRLVPVQWGDKIRNNYSVDIVIKAYNRRGLVRDISAIVSGEDVDIITIQSLTDKESNKADFRLKIEVPSIDVLGRVLTKIQQIPNIIEVFRVDA
jgi:GTP pyrophosphokinase